MIKTTPTKHLLILSLLLTFFFGSSAKADTYQIDPSHSFVEFKILHLGYSVLKGRFNTIRGQFNYDENNPTKSNITVEIETKSIDSNHAKRDKHLRGSDFLNVEKYPLSTFKSVSYKETADNGIMTGDLTLHGVTKRVEIPVSFIGSGMDPWGGYRRGYQGQLKIKRSDFDMGYNLGKAAEEMTLELFIEGIRQ